MEVKGGWGGGGGGRTQPKKKRKVQFTYKSIWLADNSQYNIRENPWAY